jgi:CDP-glycerol glycerophosphotransferase (TagB/SpsB family)
MSKQKNIHWRFLHPGTPPLQREEFYSKYDLLVSPWYQGDLAAAYNKKRRLVRVMYGYAKDPWNYGLWNVFFDTVLTYGPYANKQLAKYTKTITTGNPKFDDFFAHKIDKKELKKIEKKLDRSKKTILYIPTYGDLSSIDAMVYAIQNLSHSYNVILKLHHNAVRDIMEYARVLSYQKNEKIHIFDDTQDIVPLFYYSDYVISDNSGVIFESVLAEKPVITIDVINGDYSTMPENGIYLFGENNEWKGVKTAKNSLDQTIKNPGHEIGPVIRVDQVSKNKQIPYDDVVKAIDMIDNKKIIYKNNLMSLKKSLFSYADGNAGKRAAEEIKKLSTIPFTQRNPLADALDEYEDYIIYFKNLKKPR